MEFGRTGTPGNIVHTVAELVYKDENDFVTIHFHKTAEMIVWEMNMRKGPVQFLLVQVNMFSYYQHK